LDLEWEQKVLEQRIDDQRYDAIDPRKPMGWAVHIHYVVDTEFYNGHETYIASDFSY